LLFHLGSTIARLKLKEIDGDTYKWWCMLFNSITRLILPILVSQPPPPSRRPHTHDRPPAPLVPPRRSRGGHVGVNGGGVARVGPAHSPPPHRTRRVKVGSCGLLGCSAGGGWQYRCCMAVFSSCLEIFGSFLQRT